MAKTMQPQKMRFSQAIQTPMYKNLVNNTLGDPARGARFIANITSAVAVNPALQECNPGTILAGALLGESLLLQPSPQLGQFYLVPFKSKAKRDRQGNVIEPASVKAQFVLGYKGYIQLALRTGQYKRLNVLEVKAGELSGWDPFEERFHEMHFIEDFQVTSGCNLRCSYCYEHHKGAEHMSIETGRKIVDYLLDLYEQGDSDCYPAFVPALSEWRPKRVRFIGMENLSCTQKHTMEIV